MKITFDLKERVFDNSLSKCYYCHKLLSFSNHGKYYARGAWHIDHKLARNQGGDDEITNLIAACIHCNLMKSDGSARIFRNLTKPERFKRRESSIKRDINDSGPILIGLIIIVSSSIYKYLSTPGNSEIQYSDERKKKSNYLWSSLIAFVAIIVIVIIINKSHATT